MLTGFLEVFLLWFSQLSSVNVKFDTSWENENKKSSKNPVNTKTDTCRSVFSNFEPILIFKNNMNNKLKDLLFYCKISNNIIFIMLMIWFRNKLDFPPKFNMCNIIDHISSSHGHMIYALLYLLTSKLKSTLYLHTFQIVSFLLKKSDTRSFCNTE